jgi:hypothetical protein
VGKNRVAYSNLEDIAEARITDRTIRKMYGFIDAAKTDEKFQKLVYSVLNTRMRGEWKQYRREAEVLLQWVKQAVDYRRDPVNVELVQDVWATLDRRRADCDDFVVLLGGALEATGTPNSRATSISKRTSTVAGRRWTRSSSGARSGGVRPMASPTRRCGRAKTSGCPGTRRIPT